MQKLFFVFGAKIIKCFCCLITVFIATIVEKTMVTKVYTFPTVTDLATMFLTVKRCSFILDNKFCTIVF